MDSQYLYNNQSTMQKEINAKYQIASKELQNLYKRSTMIEPLLQILEDIYSKVDEGAAIAPLSLSINQIKSLNADIKTCLLNVKEKKSGPFQRIIKNKGENIEALESKMDKLIKDLEVALNNAEEAAKKSSEKKRQQKASSNNNNKYNEQAQPTKYSLTDNYPQDYYNTTENYSNNYSYNNNAANDYSYQETNNYNNNNNNTGLDASLANQFSYLNVNDGNNAGNNNNAQVNDNAKYNYDNNTNTNQQAQPQISVQPPDYQESQETYNSYPQDTSGQFYNTYSNPSQQYYYGTLTKPDQQQQQQQQQMNNYNQYQQQNPQMMYNDPNQLQMQQMQMQQMQMQQMQMQQQMQQQQMQQQQMQQQQMQQQQMQQQQMQQQQMQQQQMAQTQISSSEATTMDGDSSINQKGLIPPTQYFAISSFTPRQPDELAIEQGDEVIIVQTFDDGWAFGRNSRTRMVGVLPMTFLSCTNQYNNYQYSNELPDRQSSRRL